MIIEKEALRKDFFTDAAVYMEKLRELFVKPPLTGHQLEEAFRLVHSLKSGAGFAGLQEMAGLAHALEDNLSEQRKGLLDEQTIHQIKQDIYKLDTLLKETETKENQNKKTEKISRSEPPQTSQFRDCLDWSSFSSFEQKLIDEACQREESIYRAVFYLDIQEKLPAARTALINSRLENKMTVIKSCLHQFQTENEKVIVYLVIFSAPSSLDKISPLFNMDGISAVYFCRQKKVPALRHSFLEEEIKFPETENSELDIQCSFSLAELNQIDAMLQELKVKCFFTEKTDGLIEDWNKEDILPVIARIEETLEKKRKTPLSEMLNAFSEVLENMAREQGKELDIQIKVPDLQLDRVFIHHLKDIVSHLLRNALDHGIEDPQTRMDLGKEPKGHILLKGQLDTHAVNKKLLLSVEDDGLGIDEAELRQLAREKGMNGSRMDLIDILTMPGFSSKEQVNLASGRGIGLNLVKKKIQENLKGRLYLSRPESEGSCFTMEVPLPGEETEVLVFSAKGRLWALPQRNVRSSFQIEQDKLYTGKDGLFWYSASSGQELALWSPFGRKCALGGVPKEKFVLLLRYLNKEALLLIDKILYRKKLKLNPETLLCIFYDATLKTGQGNLRFLSPSIINSLDDD